MCNILSKSNSLTHYFDTCVLTTDGFPKIHSKPSKQVHNACHMTSLTRMSHGQCGHLLINKNKLGRKNKITSAHVMVLKYLFLVHF